MLCAVRAAQVVTIGLKTVRELCTRTPLVMTPELLQVGLLHCCCLGLVGGRSTASGWAVAFVLSEDLQPRCRIRFYTRSNRARECTSQPSHNPQIARIKSARKQK